MRLTHPERPVFDEPPVDKRQLADFYAALAEPLLRAIRRRPVSLVRCPGLSALQPAARRDSSVILFWQLACPRTSAAMATGSTCRPPLGIVQANGVISIIPRTRDPPAAGEPSSVS